MTCRNCGNAFDGGSGHGAAVHLCPDCMEGLELVAAQLRQGGTEGAVRAYRKLTGLGVGTSREAVAELATMLPEAWHHPAPQREETHHAPRRHYHDEDGGQATLTDEAEEEDLAKLHFEAVQSTDSALAQRATQALRAARTKAAARVSSANGGPQKTPGFVVIVIIFIIVSMIAGMIFDW